MVASIQQHAGEQRSDEACAAGHQHTPCPVPRALVRLHRKRCIEQLLERDGARAVDVAPPHEAVDAADRPDADARVLEALAERPHHGAFDRGHRDDHFPHVALLRDGEGILHRSEDRHAVERGADLGGVVVQESDELHPRCGAFHELAADREAVLARPYDEHPMRGRHSLDRRTFPPLGVGHRPAAQRAHADAEEQHQEHQQQGGSGSQVQQPEELQHEQRDEHDGAREGHGERVRQAGVAPDRPVRAAQRVGHDQEQADQQRERNRLGHAEGGNPFTHRHRDHDRGRGAPEVDARFDRAPRHGVREPGVYESGYGREGPDGPGDAVGELVQFEAGRGHPNSG